jgi:hypothetical protein
VDNKPLIDVGFSGRKGVFQICASGKFAEPAIGNPLKMMDVGSLSINTIPNSNFAALRALAQRGLLRHRL